MAQFSFGDQLNFLTNVGFASSEAHALVRVFSPRGRRNRIRLLDDTVNAAAIGQTCTINLGFWKKYAITLDPGKTAALCYFIMHTDDIDTRRWLVTKLPSTAWKQRLPLLCT